MKEKELYTTKLYGQSDNDLLLWKKFLKGDDVSFETIYRKYVRSLFRYGIQFTHDKEVVEDAIHDVFIKIYNKRTHLKEDVSLKFYLFTALKNCLYNTFKRELYFEKLEENEISNILDKSLESESIVPLENDPIKEEVFRLMNVLTDRQREVIYYRFIEEMDTDEISLLMDMNYQSVQNLIQRSLKKLRKANLPPVVVFFLIYRFI